MLQVLKDDITRKLQLQACVECQNYFSQQLEALIYSSCQHLAFQF